MYLLLTLTVKLSKNTSYDDVMEALKKASENELRRSIRIYRRAGSVYKIFYGDARTSVVDAKARYAT